MAMPWFKQIFGFTELTYAETQTRFRIESDKLHTNTQPPRSFQVGILTTPNVGELRTQVGALTPLAGTRLTLRTISADAYALHTWPEAHGALIQVASQFNLLEMPGPSTTPEDGITGYQHANGTTEGGMGENHGRSETEVAHGMQGLSYQNPRRPTRRTQVMNDELESRVR